MRPARLVDKARKVLVEGVAGVHGLVGKFSLKV